MTKPEEGQAGAHPTNEQIMKAIGDSGYLMEQQVATQLQSLDFHIKTNAAYEDTEEGKSREVDVLGYRQAARDDAGMFGAYAELVVECKNSNNPLVFITRPKDGGDAGWTPSTFRYPARYEMQKDLGVGKGIMMRTLNGFAHLGFDQIHYQRQQTAKAVQFCRIDRKGSGWHANHGGLYDAIFYPMAKAITARIADRPHSTQQGSWRFIAMLFPVVVTSGDLLVVDSTQTNPTPESREWVSFSRELKSGKLSGAYTLDFVRQDCLEKYVRECIDPLCDRARELVLNQGQFLLKSECPWKD